MMRSFQRPVELGRLGNELPVLGKDNPLFKLVKCCAFKLTVLPVCDLVRDKDIPGYRSSAKSMYRTDL